MREGVHDRLGLEELNDGVEYEQEHDHGADRAPAQSAFFETPVDGASVGMNYSSQ